MITLNLMPTTFYTRYSCTICGGHTEKVSILTQNKEARVRVCERCLEQGESWSGESGQIDKWIFCLTAASVAAYQERP